MDRDIVVHRLDAKVSHRPSEPVCAPALPGHRPYGTDIGSRPDGRAGLRGAGRPLVVGGARVVAGQVEREWATQASSCPQPHQ
ncbi:hypothetical protein [Streptomyces sp. NPDC057747]|uniref:hypothetical protein n=1 Tax=Streptomyces sp. NPDC057747 TaxID=3346238 RepID=UPI003679328A